MEKKSEFTFRKGDWIAVILVILMAVSTFLCFLPKDTTDDVVVVQIYKDSTLIKECNLNVNETFVIEGEYVNTVTIKDGKIGITESNCPGTDCVHSGLIGTVGRSIVCLPNKVEIRITGEAEVDIVVR